MSIYATNTPVRPPSTRRPCSYCGRVREARKTALFCAACAYILTDEERAAWAA